MATKKTKAVKSIKKVKANAKSKVIKTVKTVKAKVVKKAKVQTKVKPKTAVIRVNAKKPQKIDKPKAKTKRSIQKSIQKPLVKSKKAKSSSIKTSSPVTDKNLTSYIPSDNEEYMNRNQQEYFRIVLLKWKDRLLEDTDVLLEVSNHPDPVDRASKEEELRLELSSLELKRKLIKKIEEAFVRLSDGSYGYCGDCGTEIGISRLNINPSATQCVSCRAVVEIKEKQTGEKVVNKDSEQN